MCTYNIKLKSSIKQIILLLLIFTVSSVFELKAGPIAEGADKFLGNIISSSPPSDFENYWNQVTCENAGKWGSVEGNRDQMNWGGIDAAYNYAKSKGFPFKHHTFLWDLQAPNWIGGLSKAEQKEEIEEWIKAYADRYPETDYVDVVNEPRDHTPSFKDAIGGDGETGWDWIVWAFETARKHLPNAKLLINEHYIESNIENALKYLEIILILKERDLIDGVGIQCHGNDIKDGNPSDETIKMCFDTLASAGIPLYPSELDLAGDDEGQLEDYKRIFPIIWEHPSVKGVTLWGYVPPIWVDNAELIRNNTERPALIWLREYVAEHKVSNEDRTSGEVKNSIPSVKINCSGQGSVRINLSYAQNISLRIFDPRGRAVILKSSLSYSKGEHTISFTTASLSQGLYLITVEGEQIRLIRKFIIGS